MYGIVNNFCTLYELHLCFPTISIHIITEERLLFGLFILGAFGFSFGSAVVHTLVLRSQVFNEARIDSDPLQKVCFLNVLVVFVQHDFGLPIV